MRKEPSIVSRIMTDPNGETYVIRAGQRVEVERPQPKVPARRAIADGFAIVPLDWAADFAKALNDPNVMLVALFAHLSWREHSDTFRLSSEILASYGVNRWTKHRMLARLEEGGLIRVLRAPGRAPIVTLLKTINLKR